ncbi:hypothetical protein BGY98DRAFT_934068 [Russula aff. rugulosa BPL654]|nr:hypothetical protein BGY98DRAFT_934068 [Russula aff. rugulosa BPL654]
MSVWRDNRLQRTNGRRNRVGTPLAPGRDPIARSASIGSTQSRATYTRRAITTSRGAHRQFGRGPDPSRSRERITRPALGQIHPRPAPYTAIPTSRNYYELPSAADESGGVGPLVPPSASSASSHQLLSPLALNEARRRLSSTSIVANVQNPSTESLPMDPHDEPVPGLPTSSSAATLDYYLPEGRFVQLINSEQIPRYTKVPSCKPRMEIPYDVKPLTTTFPYFPESNGFEQDQMNQPDCSPWVPATHPEGALYFYDQERDLSIPSNNYDLVLDIRVTDDERISWSYYYACHEARCLFWLETYDATDMISDLFGVRTPAHVKHRMESLYWNHWSLFPIVFDGRRLLFDVYDELMGILMHGCIDVITSKSSTLPYDDDTMRRMIRLVQAAKEATGGLVYYHAGIARLLSFFAHWRFLHFHGETHARLIQDQSVYDKPERERSLLITLLSPLLFLAPDAYLREMEKFGRMR